MAASGTDRLTIAHVTPLPWGQRHEINEFVERTSAELAERGHRVVVAAPSSVGGGTREARRLIDAARERPEALFNGSWRGERAGDGGPPVLAVGTGLPMPRGARPRGAPLPLDVSKGLDALLGGVEFDIVHVHDPFAPSAASLALRHSRSLNVGSFHEPSERVLSTQVARPLVEVFFGRLDARTASCGETADLMRRYFPGSYELVEPGTRSLEGAWPGQPRVGDGGPLRIAYCLEEERGALRLFMRALRRLPADARLGGGDLAAGRRRGADVEDACASGSMWLARGRWSPRSWLRRPTSSASHPVGRGRARPHPCGARLGHCARRVPASPL